MRGDPLREPWRWRAFTEMNGLDAQCVAEARDGTIWFGTADGLSSYDGFEWKRHLATDGGVIAGWVATMCHDADGTLNAAGWWGISQFKQGKWTRLVPAVGVRFADVRRIVTARDGSLWAATSWGALRRHQNSWTLYTDAANAARLERDERYRFLRIERLPEAVLSRARPGALPANRGDLYEAAIDERGRVWLGTKNGEILLYTPAATGGGGTWTLHNETDGLHSGRVPAILPLRDGAVWVVTAPGEEANVFDGAAWRRIALPAPGVAPDGARLLQTRDGVIWLSARYVLYAFRDGAWHAYEQPHVPVPHALNLLLQSADGALWIAGQNTDVLRVDYETPRWSTLRDLNFQWESAGGAQWFLHRSGRVVVHEGGRWASFGPEDGLIDAPVALLGTRNGVVWAAGSHEHTAATARFEDGKWMREIHADFSWGIDWRGTFESSDGSVWFGAAVDSSGPKQHRDGILQFRNGGWTHHHQPGRSPRADGAESPATLLPASHRPEPIEKYACFGESRDGNIWSGRNVLVFHGGKKWEELLPRAEFPVGIIESMLTTRERELWIGTRQYGAFRYDGRAWEQFQGKDALAANSVRSLAQAADGSIWAATDRGISRFDGQTWTNEALPEVLMLPHEGGALKTTPSGKLWLNRHTIDWNRRGWTKQLPPASDAEFWTVCHQSAGPAPRTVLVTTGADRVSQPGNLSLLWRGVGPWREAKDVRLQFSFRLDEQAWSPFTSEHGHAFFTLPAGPHRFEVRARDQDFNVDPAPATLDFVVLPPVWRQGWFIALMIALGGAVATQTMRVFLERARLRHSNRELGAEIAARTRTEAALNTVLRHARTIIIHNLVTAPKGWSPQAAGWSAADFEWQRSFEDERSAREVLPLDVPPGQPYHVGWEAAKHRDDREPMAAVATRAFATGATSWQQEFRCLDRDGRVHWFTQVASIETLGPGRWRVTTTNTDITQRVLAEEALRSSEERLSSVFHLSPTSIIIVRAADQRIVELNEAFARGCGYSREELIGRTPIELDLWENPDERAAILRELETRGTAIAFKLRGRRKSGDIGVGLASMTRIVFNGEEHLLTLIQDITGLERAEEARRASDDRLRQVTESIDEVFWITDATKTKVVYVSPAYQRVWGRSCESILAAPQTWLDAIHPEDREQVRATAILNAHRHHEIEYRIVRPDETVRWIHERAAPIRDADGRLHQIAGVASDITEKRLLEVQLRQTQKMESLGTLAGGIAHDFNNILTAILGSAEIVRLTMPASDPSRPWIANILNASARAKNLVQQILTFSRRHETKMLPRKIQRDVDEALRLLRSSIPSTIEIDARIDATCPPVVADETQIHQVVMNLCTNAWHALPPRGGRIEVGLALVPVTAEMTATRLGLQTGPHVRLTVRDNGSGMSPETLARIFEPFFTTKAQGVGTGLGLAVVHGIVQSHHGGIFVQSTPGRGTCFEVFLPAIVERDPTADAVAEESIVRGRQERILLVDDDGIALAALRGQLEHIGYRVTAVSDPHSALKFFLTQPAGFDLVLTDSTMPGMSGRELCERLLAARPNVPVLIATGFSDAQEFDDVRALGVREIIRKPAVLAELAKVIARYVRINRP